MDTSTVQSPTLILKAFVTCTSTITKCTRKILEKDSNTLDHHTTNFTIVTIATTALLLKGRKEGEHCKGRIREKIRITNPFHNVFDLFQKGLYRIYFMQEFIKLVPEAIRCIQESMFQKFHFKKFILEISFRKVIPKCISYVLEILFRKTCSENFIPEISFRKVYRIYNPEVIFMKDK